MKTLLCPSMMCAHVGCLEKEVHALEDSGIDIFHLDVMDGSFVPNFGMGMQDIAYICQTATKPCDVHLMVNHPNRYIDVFAHMGAKIIYVHPEADCHIARTLQQIKDAGVAVGLAINPGTSYETVKDVLSLVDYVLIMTVNPGFSGQAFLDFVHPKIRTFIDVKEQFHYQIIIDGACSPERMIELSQIGVDGFVVGTAALFGKERAYQDICQELKQQLERGE